jgi:hypothetical protein
VFSWLHAARRQWWQPALLNGSTRRRATDLFGPRERAKTCSSISRQWNGQALVLSMRTKASSMRLSPQVRSVGAADQESHCCNSQGVEEIWARVEVTGLHTPQGGISTPHYPPSTRETPLCIQLVPYRGQRFVPDRRRSEITGAIAALHRAALVSIQTRSAPTKDATAPDAPCPSQFEFSGTNSSCRSAKSIVVTRPYA